MALRAVVASRAVGKGTLRTLRTRVGVSKENENNNNNNNSQPWP